MKDLIYRQDAIDEIEYELEMMNSELDSITLDFETRGRLRQRIGEAREILNSIQQLPSAQPKPSTEIQEILEYLDTTIHPIVSPDNWNVYSELHDMVSSLPSNRGKGKWIRKPDSYGLYDDIPVCSECGCTSKMRGASIEIVEEEYKFCPNCGAEMEDE